MILFCSIYVFIIILLLLYNIRYTSGNILLKCFHHIQQFFNCLLLFVCFFIPHFYSQHPWSSSLLYMPQWLKSTLPSATLHILKFQSVKGESGTESSFPVIVLSVDSCNTSTDWQDYVGNMKGKNMKRTNMWRNGLDLKWCAKLY